MAKVKITKIFINKKGRIMFENKTKTIEGPGTIVGANVKLAGTLKDVNDITIHGQVEGEVISDKNVMVEATAMIKGPVKAKNVTVAGKIVGEIHSEESLEVTESGNVSGIISAKNLSIKPGAIFNGKCKMTDDGEKNDGKAKTDEKDKAEDKPKEIKDDKKDEKKDEPAKKNDHDLFKHMGSNKYELE
jgi:cytoskeletal protein CcmA (bactofilin family)